MHNKEDNLLQTVLRSPSSNLAQQFSYTLTLPLPNV